jgi:predicted TPR repeat methyltransferase
MNDTSPTDLLRAAMDHHRAGRLDEAEAFFRRAAENDSAGEARLNLGMVLHERGRLLEAAEVLSLLVADHPELAAAWVQLARVIAPEGFTWEAHHAIAKALKANPDAETLVAASMVLMMLEHKAEAESAARRAVEMSPENAHAWIQLGQCLAVSGRRPDAAAAYQRALTIEPDNAVAMFFFAALNGGGNGAPAVAPPEYVRTLFDGFAERFDGSLVGSLKYQTPRMLDRLFGRWLADAHADPAKPLVMLDAGCGTGLCGLWLTKHRGRLIGVDLSRGMIAKAKERGAYDELIVGEVVAELKKCSEELDLIIAADVLVYMGDLARLFAAAAAALRAGGVFLFSVEAATDADFLLLPTQRYAHSLNYLHRLAESNGLTMRFTEESVLRLEKGADVPGYLVLAEKKA